MKLVYDNENRVYKVFELVNENAVSFWQEVYSRNYKKYAENYFNENESRNIKHRILERIKDKKLFMYLINMNKDINIILEFEGHTAIIDYKVNNDYNYFRVKIDDILMYDITAYYRILKTLYISIENTLNNLVKNAGDIKNIDIEYKIIEK